MFKYVKKQNKKYWKLSPRVSPLFLKNNLECKMYNR